MHAKERENTIRFLRKLVDQRPTAVSLESLEGTERMIEALPDYVPTPSSVSLRKSNGTILKWNLTGEVGCQITVNDQGEADGLLYRETGALLAKFGYDEDDAVEDVTNIPSDFMGKFRKACEHDVGGASTDVDVR